MSLLVRLILFALIAIASRCMAWELIFPPDREGISQAEGLMVAALLRGGNLTYSAGMGPEYLAVTVESHQAGIGPRFPIVFRRPY